MEKQTVSFNLNGEIINIEFDNFGPKDYRCLGVVNGMTEEERMEIWKTPNLIEYILSMHSTMFLSPTAKVYFMVDCSG